MIITNFFANSDFFENQKALSSDSSDAKNITEDFAAFFTVPVFAPPIIAPVPEIKQENPIEAGVAPQSKQNLIGNSYQVKPVFLQDDDSGKQKSVEPENEIFSMKREVPIVVSEKFADPKYQEAPLVFEVQQPSNFFGKVANFDFTIENNYNFQINPSYANTGNTEFTVNLPLELTPLLNGQKNITQIQSAKTDANDFSTEIKQGNFSFDDTGQLLNKNSDVEKTNEFVKTDFTLDLANEEKIFKQISQDITKGAGEIIKESEYKAGTENSLTTAFKGKAHGTNLLEINNLNAGIHVSHQKLSNSNLTTVFHSNSVQPLSEQPFIARKQTIYNQINQISPLFDRKNKLEKVPQIFSGISNILKTDDFNQANFKIEFVSKPVISEIEFVSKPVISEIEFVSKPIISEIEFVSKPVISEIGFVSSQVISEQSETDVTDESKVNILTRNPAENAEIVQASPIFEISPEFDERRTSDTLSKITGEISNILKSDDFRQPVAEIEPATEQIISIRPEAEMFSENGKNLLTPKMPEIQEISQVLPRIEVSPEFNRKQITEKVPQIFSGISNILKTDDFNQANFKIEFVSKPVISEIEFVSKPVISEIEFVSKPIISEIEFVSKPVISEIGFVSSQVISEQSETDVTDESKVNISTRNPAENAEIVQASPVFEISPEFNPKKILSDLPKFTDKFSKQVKADNSVIESFTSHFAGKEKIVEVIKQTDFDEAGQNSNQRETPGNTKQSKFQDNSPVRIFDNFLNSVKQKTQTIEDAPLVDDLKEKIFAQIEPRILDLTNRTLIGDEKKIFRMRLKPDELGAVEITMKKSESGVFSAHFRTESETTRQVLQASVDQLRSSLENSGCAVGELEISCGSFSSNGSENRENQSQKFGSTETRSVAGIISDGNSNTEEDEQNRLVSLRA